MLVNRKSRDLSQPVIKNKRKSSSSQMNTEIFNNLSAKIGTRIRILRETKNMTQQDLADQCNFDKADMSKIESGKANPTIKTLLRISQALEVNFSDLFQIEDI